MSAVRILVTGAGGTLARHVARTLTERGERVRAGSRTPAAVKGLPDEAEVVPLDLAEPNTFAPALEGVDKVFLYCEPRGIEAFTATARDAGVGQLTVLSSTSVVDGQPSANPVAAHRARVEAAVAVSGPRWAFVRAGSLATGALRWAARVRTGVVRGPYARSETAPVHEGDVAAVGLAAVTDSGHTARRTWSLAPSRSPSASRRTSSGRPQGGQYGTRKYRPMRRAGHCMPPCHRISRTPSWPISLPVWTALPLSRTPCSASPAPPPAPSPSGL
ncbi:SDR family oxidoreductase [Streptomyces sp. NA02950]|uniref:SDR family oxidoreductase n=1 Tax=Streptomyces sp. NA02950 TaxID=2742137 RepID=UPI0020CAE4BD|nr:NAD(P)H-binding protein [Streptomyces sp. NA02950]